MKNFFKRTTQTLNSERKGFAITFEIMMSMLLVAFATSVVIYFCEVLNVQRFFFDVTASTCTTAARYGGDQSRAYKFQVQRGNPDPKDTAGTISQNANAFLRSVATRTSQAEAQAHGGFVLEPMADGNYIQVSDYPDNNGKIQVRLRYKLGRYGWGAIAQALIPDGGQCDYTVQLPTLMQNGKLITGAI